MSEPIEPRRLPMPVLGDKANEPIVAMVECGGTVYVATQKRVYHLVEGIFYVTPFVKIEETVEP